VSGFAAPAYIGTGLMAEAGVLFVDHLFAHWPYRELYFDVPAYNEPSLASAVRDVLVEEGSRRAHYFFDGAYHDDRTYALWRDRWMAARDRLLAAARGNPAATVAEPLDLDRFCRRVADGLCRRPEAVQPESSLIDDLAVDSLEMLVLQGVLEELAGTRCSYEVDHLPATVRDLFLLYCELASSPRVPHSERNPR
jgi:acyl carrier protein